MKYKPDKTNPIRVGDAAYAMGVFGTILNVDRDRVQFREDVAPQSDSWRHWKHCYYSPDVLERLMPKKPRARRAVQTKDAT